MSEMEHIGVVGGGVIGLSVGWQLLRSGKSVTILERGEAGNSTGSIAAGMLAPQAEVGFEEVDLMKLGQKSLSLYPGFLEELQEDAGDAPQLDPCGTMLVGTDRDEAEILRKLYRFRNEVGVEVEWLGSEEAREKEPLLSPRVVGAVWLPGDAQLDNRKLLAMLRTAFLNRGGRIREGVEVKGVEETSEGKMMVTGLEKGDRIFDKVVLAAGAWTPLIQVGVNQEVNPAVRPVKGQILTLEGSDEVDLEFMIRFPRGYIVPKMDGTVRIGASSEEKGYDDRSTAGEVKDILEEAWKVLPSIYDLPLRKMEVGIRPGSRDHSPLIGKGGDERLWWATGHYRHGILLAPATAYGLVKELNGGDRPGFLKGFEPNRQL